MCKLILSACFMNRETNQENMKVLVNKAVTFVEEMEKQIESNSGPERRFKQPKTLIGGK